jgi:tetratricopeptide (TPR) repeat protein
MAIRNLTRSLLALSLSTACLAQTPAQNPPAAPCPNTSQTPDQANKPCTQSPAEKKSTAERFPFPGASKPAPATTPDASAPDASAPGSTPKTSPGDAASQHPFPTAPPPKLPGSDSSSSSSSSSSDADDPDVPKFDAPSGTGNPPEGTSVHRKLPKPKRVQSDDERVDEDLNVAKFYMRDENYQGAYLRAKDAVKIQPEYSSAHFALAETAQKLKKKDEAIAEYEAYLKMDPDGEKAKAAKQALADLKK